MKKSSIQMFLFFAILFFLLLFPAYSRYISLLEAALFPIDLSLAHSDQDDQFQAESGAVLPSVFSIAFLPGTDFVEQSSLFPLPLASSFQLQVDSSLLRKRPTLLCPFIPGGSASGNWPAYGQG